MCDVQISNTKKYITDVPRKCSKNFTFNKFGKIKNQGGTVKKSVETFTAKLQKLWKKLLQDLIIM